MVILRRLSSAHFLDQEGKVGIFQDDPGGLRTGKLQSILCKIAVIMGQTGKIPAGIAQSGFSQFCLDPAQAVHAPHGAAMVFDGHKGEAVLILQNLAEAIA